MAWNFLKIHYSAKKQTKKWKLGQDYKCTEQTMHLYYFNTSYRVALMKWET